MATQDLAQPKQERFQTSSTINDIPVEEVVIPISVSTRANTHTLINLAQAPKKTQPTITFPEGGLEAWLNIFGCFLLSFSSYGMKKSPGRLYANTLCRSAQRLRGFPNLLC